MKDSHHYAFISYQTDDKSIAGKLKKFLSGIEIISFLAHEDINVSDEWRDRILEEIEKADIFVCLLSDAYYQSPWCVQESGIAVYRDITIIPLAIDNSIPRGFIRHIQSTKVDEFSMYFGLIHGLLKYDNDVGLEGIIQLITWSNSYRGAEAAFEMFRPYFSQLNNSQAVKLLQASVKNSQIHGASLCAKDLLPPLLESYGHLLDEGDLDFLKGKCAIYK